jgi:stage II sporulation protein AA (anti-sigma F factor antagonist)
MELTNAVLGDVPMLVATGAIDHGTCGVLQGALDRLFEARLNVIFLDFSNVAYIDSGGLSVLRAGVRTLGRRGWLGLIGLNADIRRLLEIDGLLVDPRIRIFENIQAARVATGERAST